MVAGFGHFFSGHIGCLSENLFFHFLGFDQLCMKTIRTIFQPPQLKNSETTDGTGEARICSQACNLCTETIAWFVFLVM